MANEESTKTKSGVRLHPDILIDTATANARVHILDTKWKDLGEDGRPSNADLYQMFAYFQRFGGRRNILLYPKTSEQQGTGSTFEVFREDAEKSGEVLVRFLNMDRNLRRDQLCLVEELKEIIEPQRRD